MTMNRVTNPLITSLAEDLKPVRPLSLREGAAWVGMAAGFTALIVHLLQDITAGVSLGIASPFYLIVNGMLAVLAIAAASTVVRMVRPRVGATHEGSNWALGMLAIVPAAALFTIVNSGTHAEALMDPYALQCMAKGVAASSLVAVALTLWLRRGAPVSLNQAGLYTGIAAGAAGSLIYGISCPVTGPGHLGIAHLVPVALAAIIGRYAIPRLVQW